jgi:hypothetical protein
MVVRVPVGTDQREQIVEHILENGVFGYSSENLPSGDVVPAAPKNLSMLCPSFA